MDFFVYSRDADGVEALRDDPDLQELHQAYMDPFADSMVARGPTFSADGETVTGSLHIVGLPNVEAAREFVEREPNNRAGVYGEHFIYRFENLLGRTMWEFAESRGEAMFLVIARTNLRPAPLRRLPAERRERLVVYGALSEPANGEPVGVALAVQAECSEAASEVHLESTGPGVDAVEIETHRWEFGGRR